MVTTGGETGVRGFATSKVASALCTSTYEVLENFAQLGRTPSRVPPPAAPPPAAATPARAPTATKIAKTIPTTLVLIEDLLSWLSFRKPTPNIITYPIKFVNKTRWRAASGYMSKCANFGESRNRCRAL